MENERLVKAEKALAKCQEKRRMENERLVKTEEALAECQEESREEDLDATRMMCAMRYALGGISVDEAILWVNSVLYPASRAQHVIYYCSTHRKACVICGARGPGWDLNWPRTVQSYAWEGEHHRMEVAKIKALATPIMDSAKRTAKRKAKTQEALDALILETGCL